jgi:hypothetical protein
MHQKNESAFRPNYIELGFLLLTCIIYVLLEFIHAIPNLRLVLLIMLSCWLGYIIRKSFKDKGRLYYWGFRRDNILVAFRSCLYFTIPVIGLLIGYGLLFHRFPISCTFWMICFLYPIWGIVQQFALQALVHRNIRDLIKPVFYRCLVLGLLFSFAHIFDWRLVALAFPIGFAFSWIYNRKPNLWALGICHGILGAMVYYLVLGLDPGREIIDFVIHSS